MITSIDELEARIGDPSRGLPEDIFLFTTRITPMVNVDLLIQNEAGHTLLTWREDGYYPPGWHIPGGIIRFKETIDERIHAVALSELGVDVMAQPVLLAMNEVIQPTWTNRAHFISLLYACTLCGAPDPGLACVSTPFPDCWQWHAGVPINLIPIHRMYANFMTWPWAIRDHPMAPVPKDGCPFD